MQRSTLRLGYTLGALLSLSAIAPATLLAQKSSVVNVIQPIRLPGAVLAPGQYDFQSIFDKTDVVLIRGINNRAVMFVRVTGTTRPKGGGIVSLHPRIYGAIAELATWYPDGGTSGYEFAKQGTG